MQRTMRLIFLHGPPAVGKLTVARELERLSGYHLFHNHLTVDLVTAIFPFGSEPFVELREQIWLSTFGVAVRSNQSLIFTFAPERTVRTDFIENARMTVEANGGQVIFIELTGSDKALESRLTSPARAQFKKLNSLDQYRELKASGAFEFPRIRSSLTIDTTDTQPPEAAQQIVDFLSTLET